MLEIKILINNFSVIPFENKFQKQPFTFFFRPEVKLRVFEGK
jgi:hypothetical protein